MSTSYRTESQSAASPLPIAVDVMGADFGPQVLIEGAIAAARNLGLSSILVGDEGAVREYLRKLNAADDSRLSVHHASEVITMEESPSTAIRRKPDASVRVAFELVKNGQASGVVSAGNTGAMMAAGILVSGTVPGVARPAIASLIPRVGKGSPVVLLDSGANVDCHAHQLVQFALMGQSYARLALGVSAPRVALLSNGTESSKGNDVVRSAATALGELKDLDFIGFVEGRDLSRDIADVVVCDGFVGNVVLKAIEGAVALFLDSMKDVAETALRGKIGIWLLQPLLRALFRDRLNPSSYGGAPLLGLNHVGIVCHGASDSRAIMNAIRVAAKFAGEGMIPSLEAAIGALDSGLRDASYSDGLWNRMERRFEKRGESKAPKIGAKLQEEEIDPKP